jgi:hypothetical protein
MFDGYTRAVERFDAAARGRDERDALIPLFEALNWAFALDDRTNAHFAPEGEVLKDYGWRDRIAGRMSWAVSALLGTVCIISGLMR